MSEHELDEEQFPSKSQRKREAHLQQALGEQLTQLKPAQLESLDLPEPLLQGVAEFQRLPNSHGARRRQLQQHGNRAATADGRVGGAAADGAVVQQAAYHR